MPTLVITLAATLVGTSVVAALLRSRAWFQAVHSVVHAIGVAFVDTSMAAHKLLVTHEIASSLRRDSGEVVRVSYL